MQKINCLIIEDEPLAAKVLAEYIAEVPFLELHATCKDAIQAADVIRSGVIDLVFLDIHLPRLKGMAFLRSLANPPAVIITTAYHQYAVEGYELNVVDYLLKPFGFERFLAAVHKLPARQRPAAMAAEPEHLFIWINKKRVKVLLNEILFVESKREYVRIVTAKKDYTTQLSTAEIETLLPAHRFKRIQRSYIIATGKVDAYSSEAVEINGVSIPVGRGFRDVLKSL